jgi:hypothetical protein
MRDPGYERTVSGWHFFSKLLSPSLSARPPETPLTDGRGVVRLDANGEPFAPRRRLSQARTPRTRSSPLSGLPNLRSSRTLALTTPLRECKTRRVHAHSLSPLGAPSGLHGTTLKVISLVVPPVCFRGNWRGRACDCDPRGARSRRRNVPEAAGVSLSQRSPRDTFFPAEAAAKRRGDGAGPLPRGSPTKRRPGEAANPPIPPLPRGSSSRLVCLPGVPNA